LIKFVQQNSCSTCAYLYLWCITIHAFPLKSSENHGVTSRAPPPNDEDEGPIGFVETSPDQVGKTDDSKAWKLRYDPKYVYIIIYETPADKGKASDDADSAGKDHDDKDSASEAHTPAAPTKPEPSRKRWELYFDLNYRSLFGSICKPSWVFKEPDLISPDITIKDSVQKFFADKGKTSFEDLTVQYIVPNPTTNTAHRDAISDFGKNAVLCISELLPEIKSKIRSWNPRPVPVSPLGGGRTNSKSTPKNQNSIKPNTDQTWRIYAQPENYVFFTEDMEFRHIAETGGLGAEVELKRYRFQN